MIKKTIPLLLLSMTLSLTNAEAQSRARDFGVKPGVLKQENSML